MVGEHEGSLEIGSTGRVTGPVNVPVCRGTPIWFSFSISFYRREVRTEREKQ